MTFARILRLALLLAFIFPVFADAGMDVVIYGGTPSGIAAAVAASREGASVTVIEPTNWIGGMVSGGLSSTDTGRAETIGGIAREFYTRAAERYHDPKQLWYAEPHANLETFETMLREAKIEVVRGQRLKAVKRDGVKITSLTTEDGKSYAGRIFIDATYEGDLMAQAGVSYIVGRESEAVYGEKLAGFRPEKVRNFSMEVMTQGCPCVGGTGPHYVHGAPTKISARDAAGKLLWGVTESAAQPGSGDALTQSYNFRFCATQRADILVPWPQPRNYQPEHYALLLRLIEAYPGLPFSRLVHLGKIANGKVDLNAQGLFSTDYVGGNIGYPDVDGATRERIWQDHIDYLQGFFWFLAHDLRVPEKLRAETQSWGLSRDEFTDNEHWPYALYVREARRMKGEYVMQQKDIQREITKPDAIAMGSFIIDSHIVQRLADPDGTVIDEGAFDAPAKPYQLPYRCLTPNRDECVNLLVPVCLSASHVAYGSIRMEPVFMACGEAAGVAARMAIEARSSVQAIDVTALQKKLRAQKVVLELAGMMDIVWASKLPGLVMDDEEAKFTGVWISSTFAGGGVEGASRHDGNDAKGGKAARYELKVPAAGRYEVRVSYTPASNRATNVPVTIEHADGTAKATVNQRLAPTLDKFFVSLGVFRFSPEKPAVVTVSNEGTDGFVAADAVQLLPAKEL
ncbi:MAG: FAD-dependent oxidoreductase [Chthoniobacteraceae bacterium]